MPRDYYEILGVQRNASDEDIRKAHRRLVRKLHPDVNKASDAAKRFAEVQEAYDILSDAEKRKKYDQFGHAGVHAEAGDPFRGGSGGGGGGPFGGAGARPGWSAGGGDGANWSDVDADTFDSIFGDLFGARRGRGGGARAGGQRSAPPQAGDDIEHTVTVPFAVAAHGGTETLRFSAGGAEGGHSIDVKIPPGIRAGAKLRVKGKGQPGHHGGPDGDLILTVAVGEHPWFRREGMDLYLDVPITIAEAALGTVIEVPLLKGSVKLKVPAGTSSGAKLRARHKGVADAKGEAGDFYAVIRIVAPESLDDQARADLERLGRQLPNPREALAWADEIGQS